MAFAALSEKHFQITREDVQRLHHLCDLLHLFHHRNKNQHRRSHWWRAFALLRRHLSALVRDIQALDSIPATHLARTRKTTTHDPRRIARTRHRLDFWRDVMFAKWHFAFGQVVADARFSVLGLVLIASLSEVGHVVGVVRELEDLAPAEAEQVLDDYWERLVEDEGELIPRKPEDEEEGEEGMADPDPATVEGEEERRVSKKPPPPAAPGATTTTTTAVKPKKKRKTGGNAIDEIFG